MSRSLIDVPRRQKPDVTVGYGRGKGGRGYSVCAWPWSYDHGPSHPYYAGTEHAGFSQTRRTLLASSAKRRGVFGESHKG